jgi:hypothetical protein
MKQEFKQTAFLVTITGILLVLSLSNCGGSHRLGSGYNGEITDSSALALVNRSHFISRDSILAWTVRYEEINALRSKNSQYYEEEVPVSSCSYNRCFVQALLSNEKCIGLRVLFGLDTEKKIHVILVGINPDYSNLYIPRPTGCLPDQAGVDSERLPGADGNNGTAGDPGVLGGLQFSQKP